MSMILRRWIVLAVAGALMVTLGPLAPANASTQTSRIEPDNSILAIHHKPAYPRLLRPYVGKAGRSWHFKKRVPHRIVKKVGKAHIRKLKRYWASVARHRYPTVVALDANGAPTIRWQGKDGTISLRWYGLRIWMDAHLTRQVLNGLLTAATIMALLKGPYCRVVALSLYFYYAGLWACRNSRTKTATVYLLATPPFPGVPGLLFCNPFS